MAMAQASDYARSLSSRLVLFLGPWDANATSISNRAWVPNVNNTNCSNCRTCWYNGPQWQPRLTNIYVYLFASVKSFVVDFYLNKNKKCWKMGCVHSPRHVDGPNEESDRPQKPKLNQAQAQCTQSITTWVSWD